MRQRIRARLAASCQYPTATRSEQDWREPGQTSNKMLIDSMKSHLPHLPVGGRLVHFSHRWRQITSDPSVLDIVQGMHIELTDLPVQRSKPNPRPLSEVELLAGDQHIQTLLAKRAIVPSSENEPNEYLSTVFLIPKRDCGFRMIFNLKRFNKYVQYEHFKMETLQHILSHITPGCFMSVFDLEDAYLTVGIAGIHVRFLKFKWRNQVYMYVVLPFGISSAPRKFTKLLKPILSFLRRQAIVILTYIDDGFTCAPTFHQCFQNICYIMQTFTYFGFLINLHKSAPFPSTQVRSLGFHINSLTMCVTLPPEKISHAIHLCTTALVEMSFDIHFLAQLIGTLISLFPACPLGRLHYRSLEFLKVEALKKSRGSFDGSCRLNSDCVNDLLWWKDNIASTACPIRRDNPSDVVFTDSSDYAWCGYFQEHFAHTHFTQEEMTNIIAFKELLAIYYALMSFHKYFVGNYILFRSDSVCAIAYLRDMGGMSNKKMNSLAKDIWSFAIQHGLWLEASFIPGLQNSDADFGSRYLSVRTEWAIPKSIFQDICRTFFTPSIDLFASRLNAQLQRYVSWTPDPYSVDVDAFLLDWSKEIPYLFPPFSVLHRCLSKFKDDKVMAGILIFPVWTTQHWFPSLIDLLVSSIGLLPKNPSLFLPWETTPMQHPLHSTLLLGAAELSMNQVRLNNFHQKLRKSSHMALDQQPERVTRQFIGNGNFLPGHRFLIPIVPL